jgi:two-component system, chemotaxis family, chemotaxis protein CheY
MPRVHASHQEGLRERSMSDRIMVIEDDPDFREALLACLEQERYDVVAATDGRAGLELLKWGIVPRVILLDLMMPVMDGWEFRRHQLADAALASIPVIVMSADPRGRRLAECGGVHAVLTKPVDFEVLREHLERLLKSGDRPTRS